MTFGFTRDEDGFAVWVMLNDDGPPHERGESFVIGLGHTLPVALDKAQKVLIAGVQVLEDLSYRIGDVEASVVDVREERRGGRT